VAFERFTVVRVPFPFTDRTASKNRPALVLSDLEAFNVPAGHSVAKTPSPFTFPPPPPHPQPLAAQRPKARAMGKGKSLMGKASGGSLSYKAVDRGGGWG
jgi:hypothetical protein